MGIVAWWRGIWKKDGGEEMPYSLVLLLRSPHVFSVEELEAAGEKGWGKAFGTDAEPMYYAVKFGEGAMLKAGGFLVSLQQVDAPYFEDEEAAVKGLPKREQKAAWREHRAWVALDFLNKEPVRGEAYAVLARFALGLGDGNCSGIYAPRDQWMFPNDGTAEEALRRMIRECPVVA